MPLGLKGLMAHHCCLLLQVPALWCSCWQVVYASCCHWLPVAGAADVACAWKGSLC